MTRKKRVCDKCLELKTNSKLKLHRPTGQLRCWNCMKKYGENKFYNAKEEDNFVGRYSISEKEKDLLVKKGFKEGLSWTQIKKRITNLKYNLKKTKTRFFKKKPDINKRFKEGLKELK
tara:strand:+ start:7172 stop:7525 length:354 start_codon:yes stop_codon:yes gene_type:complete